MRGAAAARAGRSERLSDLSRAQIEAVVIVQELWQVEELGDELLHVDRVAALDEVVPPAHQKHSEAVRGTHKHTQTPSVALMSLSEAL